MYSPITPSIIIIKPPKIRTVTIIAAKPWKGVSCRNHETTITMEYNRPADAVRNPKLDIKRIGRYDESRIKSVKYLNFLANVQPDDP